jgi:hypothetical protein
MKLLDLKPVFIARTDQGHRPVERIEDAEGVRFLCPKCFAANGGSRGTHSVICWGPTVPQTVSPKPGRWTLVGTSLADLTLNGAHGKSRSVLLTGAGCGWHGYITDGEATDA